MAAANAELEKLAQEGGLEGKRLEDVGEGDEYVEMELGLGVMEEKKEGDDSSDETSDESSDDSSEDSSEEDDDDDEKEQKKKQKEKEQKEKDILGRLMGHKQGREKAAGIQEVEWSTRVAPPTQSSLHASACLGSLQVPRAQADLTSHPYPCPPLP